MTHSLTQHQEAEDPLQHRDHLQMFLHLGSAGPQSSGHVLQGREDAGARALKGVGVGVGERHVQ